MCKIMSINEVKDAVRAKDDAYTDINSSGLLNEPGQEPQYDVYGLNDGCNVGTITESDAVYLASFAMEEEACMYMMCRSNWDIPGPKYTSYLLYEGETGTTSVVSMDGTGKWERIPCLEG